MFQRRFRVELVDPFENASASVADGSAAVEQIKERFHQIRVNSAGRQWAECATADAMTQDFQPEGQMSIDNQPDQVSPVTVERDAEGGGRRWPYFQPGVTSVVGVFDARKSVGANHRQNGTKQTIYSNIIVNWLIQLDVVPSDCFCTKENYLEWAPVPTRMTIRKMKR